VSVSVSVTVRRLSVAAAVAAAVVGSAALPASAASHSPVHDSRNRVVISAVHAGSLGRDDRSNRSLNRNWVEVSNTGRRDVNLDRWTLSDGDGHVFTFHHFRLDGRSSVRVHSGQGLDNRTDLYQGRRTYVWDSRSDTATLRDDHGRFVDDASWGRDHRRSGDDTRVGGDWRGRHDRDDNRRDRDDRRSDDNHRAGDHVRLGDHDRRGDHDRQVGVRH
jgi:hypothetical protein